jgi:hypothetical protein
MAHFRQFYAAVQHPSLCHDRQRKDAMFARFISFLRSFDVHPVREVQLAYLSGAVDRADLEFRKRQLDRGLFGHFDG